MSRSSRLFTLAFFGALFAGCISDHLPDPHTCRLINSAVTSSLDGLTLTYSWTYNADGQLVSNARYRADLNLTYTDQTYEYDSNGFLISTTSYDRNTAYSKNTYRYKDGRLASDTQYRYDLDRTISTKTYEYDNAGNVNRIVYRFMGGATVYVETYLFTNGQQTDYSLDNLNVGVVSRPYRFENGHIKQEIRQDATGNITYSSIDYTYDAKRRLIRSDHTSDQASYYELYDYTDGQMAPTTPSRKGWPVVTINSTGQVSGSLLAKKTTYRKDSAGQFNKSSELIYTYTKNMTGFPLTAEEQFQIYDPAGQLSSQSRSSYTTYTYDNCQ